MIRKIFFSLLILLCLEVKSQDFLFSQYFAAQPYLNPALTGFFDGSYRVNAIYRTQWATLNPGISTYGVNGEYKYGNHEGEGDNFSIGIAGYRDDIYNRIYYTTGRLNLAFSKKLGYGLTKHYLAIGTNMGMDMKEVNGNLITPDGNPTNLPTPNNYIPNLGLGLNYQIVFPSFANVFVGGAMDHLVSDKISALNTDVKAEKRLTIYSSARLEVSDYLFLIPVALYAKQGAQTQVNYGVSSQFLMRDYYNTKTNLQLGINARMGNQGFDALIGLVRYENRGIQLGLSYDHNLTELNAATGGFGALELTVGYIGLIQRVIQSKAPCPNLKNF